MTKRQQQKEDTKNRIVEASYSVYAELGFKAATNDIAKIIGISHGTVFAHFPTKDDLLIYLLEDFGNRISIRMHELTETSGGLRDVLNAHLNVISEQEDFYTRFITEIKLLPVEIRGTFIGIQSAIAFHFEKVIENEKAAGTVKDLPGHFIFNLWMGQLHYYLQNKDIFAPEGSVVQRYREELVGHFIEF